ncbi:3333_t:CDS:10 [Gigaspora rosea]|nr:3333_t:CDS:10 [Gigaspora rosea]
MSSEPAESQIAAVIEEFFKIMFWSLIKYLQYRKEAEDFTYSKRKELRLYRSSSKIEVGSKLEYVPCDMLTNPSCQLPSPWLIEKSSEAVKNFWILIDKEHSKHVIENIQLDYAKRVLNDTNNETHQICDISSNNTIKTLKHALEGDENNKEKKKMSASGKEERAHCSDTSHTIPPLQQSELFNNGYNTPSALNNSLVEPLMLIDRINNPFIAEDEVDDIFIIDDVDDLCFIDGNSVDDYKIEETNFFAIGYDLPTNYPDTATALDSECEAKFKDAIKRATKELFSNAMDWLMAELSNNKPLKDNIGFMDPNYNPGLYKLFALFGLEQLYCTSWTILMKNTGLNESKARKSEGRSKQPDFVVSAIYQLQICGVIFVAEGMDLKVLGFQCIDFYMMDLIQGIYMMTHIGQVNIPSSIKGMNLFVNEIETLLRVREIFLRIIWYFIPHEIATGTVQYGMDGLTPKDIERLSRKSDDYFLLEIRRWRLCSSRVKFGCEPGEQSLLARQFVYWSVKERQWSQTTISEILDNGMNQLSKYLNVIAKGPVPDKNYTFTGVCDERLKATNSKPVQLKGFVVLVAGFHTLLWRAVEEKLIRHKYYIA